jgi:hypothetical protein
MIFVIHPEPNLDCVKQMYFTAFLSAPFPEIRVTLLKKVGKTSCK